MHLPWGADSRWPQMSHFSFRLRRLLRSAPQESGRDSLSSISSPSLAERYLPVWGSCCYRGNRSICCHLHLRGTGCRMGISRSPDQREGRLEAQGGWAELTYSSEQLKTSSLNPWTANAAVLLRSQATGRYYPIKGSTSPAKNVPEQVMPFC